MLFNRIRKSPCPPLLLGGTQLEYVGSHKFQGMTLDRKLSWNTHILSLRDRFSKDLRIQSILSARNGGPVLADTISISRIYRSLILPKLDYRSFLYSTAAPTYSKMLDRIQYGAIRIIFGALKCTRVDCLEAEANIIPLVYRSTELLIRYIIRTLSISLHPFSELYSPLSVVGRVYELFRKYNLSVDMFKTYPLEQRCGYIGIKTRTSLAVNKKSDKTDVVWSQLATKLHASEYSDRIAV